MEMPNELKTAIESKAEGIPMEELKRSAAALSERYRSESGQGKRLVTGATDIAAYAFVRMPATFGAVYSALRYTLEAADMEIRTVLDAGAGTGASAWAVSELIPSFDLITCMDRVPSMCC